jgi:uncharacterized protein YdbL (DUF1318 family)
MAKHKPEPIAPGLNGRRLNELVDKPVDEEAEAQARINAGKEARAKEYGEILTREGHRLKCSLVAIAEIAGDKVSTRVVIVPQ